MTISVRLIPIDAPDVCLLERISSKSRVVPGALNVPARQPGIQAAREPGSQAARQPGSQAARQPGSQSSPVQSSPV